MTLLQQYVRAVRTYLPRRPDLDDILTELTEHLQARLDEHQEAMGRPLTELEQEQVLSEHGNPAVVADRYGATNRGVSFGIQLIGPELFPLYVRLLLFQWGLTGLVWMGINRLSTSSAVSPIGMLVSVVFQLALLTSIFTAIDRLQRRARHGDPTSAFNWHFPPSYRRPIPRWQSATGFVVLTSVALWWALLPRIPALLLGRATGRLALAPEWLDFYWPVLLLLLLGVAQRAISFAHPEWNWLQPIVRLATNAGAVALTWPLLQIGPFIHPLTSDPRTVALARWISGALWWNLLCGLALYWSVNVMLHIWFCVQHLRYAMRRKRERRLLMAPRGLRAL